MKRERSSAEPDSFSGLDSPWERELVCAAYVILEQEPALAEQVRATFPKKRAEALTNALLALKMLPPVWAKELVRAQIGDKQLAGEHLRH